MPTRIPSALHFTPEQSETFIREMMKAGRIIEEKPDPITTALQELRDEIAALREDLRPRRSIIATGEDVMEEYRRLQGGRHE